MIFVLLIIFISILNINYSSSIDLGLQISNSGQFPYIVSIQDYNNNHIYTGTIIHMYWIITTSQSIEAETKLYKLVMCQGKPPTSENWDQIYYEIELIMRYPFQHEDFNKPSSPELYEISLIKTYKNILFNQFVQPIPITDETEAMFNYDGSYIYDIGIITQRDYDMKTRLNHIRKHIVRIMDRSKCYTSPLNVEYSHSTFCTTVITNRARYYKRGSPLLINNTLYGLLPSIFQDYEHNFVVIKISFFLPWIQNVIYNISMRMSMQHSQTYLNI